MGCNCGGSTPPSEKKLQSPAQAGQRTDEAQRPLRRGGPGSPGYAWNGPPRPAPKPE